MIVSHRHRFIFFAVPKTATHAVRQALGAHLGPDDWEQQVLFERQYLPVPELAAVGHGHISARQARPHFEAFWDAYFKFAIVRNPFDRFVSTCSFLNRGNARYENNAQAFMKKALGVERFQRRILVAPQSSLLNGEGGQLAMDYVGRFEDLQSSFDDICGRIGVPTVSLEQKNVSRHRKYLDYYDEELKSQVAEFYRDDLAQFAYDFDAPVN